MNNYKKDTLDSRIAFFISEFGNNIEQVLYRDYELLINTGGNIIQGYHFINSLFNNPTNCASYTGTFNGYYGFYFNNPIQPFQNIDFGRITQ